MNTTVIKDSKANDFKITASQYGNRSNLFERDTKIAVIEHYTPEQKEYNEIILTALNYHDKLIEALETCYNWAKNGNKEDLIVFSEAGKLLQSLQNS